jgi:catechol 2,3-dioxygenase-like lactoylglutathione lyase family enzyme
MKRVVGIGGIFIKSGDPDALRDWYRRHLGMDIQDWGGLVFQSPTPGGPDVPVSTVWSVHAADSAHFEPSTAAFMVNYRVHDLNALLAALRAEGCTVDDKVEKSEFGQFGWVMDPQGNRVELWQPPDATEAGR